MSFGKWVSLGIGLAASLLVAVFLAYFALTQTPGQGQVTAIVVTCLLTGLAVTGLHWALVSQYENHVEALITHVEALDRPDHELAPFTARMGLENVQATIEKTVGSLRKRAGELISHRREMEVQIRIAEAQRRHAEAILNTICDAVIVTDAFNEVALANEAAARILHFELGEALRKPIDRILSDPSLVKVIKDTREGGDTALRRHIEHHCGVGDEQAVYDVTLACLDDGLAHKEAAGVVTILRDVTREKEIAEMKSDFVSNVSHELRTPLSSIKAYMEMLVDGEAGDEQTRTEFYNIIQGETNRLSRLIDNILNISRIESGVVKVQREHISLPALIKEAIDVMQPQARAKNIELTEVPTPLFFQVFADKDMIYQATMNLIGNAIKYTPADGRVSVSISVDETDRMVNVAVKDTGVGVPAEDLPYVFDKFYRVKDHKKLAKGTGLGLNLVKHIVETVHGGQVSVISEPGKGSTFTFSLPMADDRG